MTEQEKRTAQATRGVTSEEIGSVMFLLRRALAKERKANGVSSSLYITLSTAAANVYRAHEAADTREAAARQG